MPEEENRPEQNAAFEGKSFVLTGSLEVYTRSKAAELIEARGGKAVSSVSKNTDCIIAGPGAGSKLKKGKELGIAIWDEQQFLDALEGKATENHSPEQGELF